MSTEQTAQFQLNAGFFANVRPFGERLADGYYAARIANLVTTDKPGNYKLVLSVDGAEIFDWFQQPGTCDGETAEKKKQREENNARKIVSILTSQGYRAADIAAGAVGTGWFLNDKLPVVHISYVSWNEPDVDGSSKMKSEIAYLTKEAYEAKLASGKAPERYKKATAAGTPTAMPGAAFQVPGAGAAGAVPNGAPAFGAPPGAPAGAPAFGAPPGGFVQPQAPAQAVQGPPGFAAPGGFAAAPGAPPSGIPGMPPGGFAQPPNFGR